MTRTPPTDELANRLPGSTTTDAKLDARCRTGRALCIDKRSSTIRWVVDGKVARTMAVRLRCVVQPHPEGLFHVGWKSRDHVSKLFGSAMPYAMFLAGDPGLVHQRRPRRAHRGRRWARPEWRNSPTRIVALHRAGGPPGTPSGGSQCTVRPRSGPPT